MVCYIHRGLEQRPLPPASDRIVLNCSEIELFTNILVLSKDSDKSSKPNIYLAQSIGNILSAVHPGNRRLQLLRTFCGEVEVHVVGASSHTEIILQGVSYTNTHSEELGEPCPFLNHSRDMENLFSVLSFTPDTPLHIT